MVHERIQKRIQRSGRTPEGHPEPEYRVALTALKNIVQVRLDGPDDRHTRALAACDEFPPILVHRPTMAILDGVHRFHAAHLRGDTHIAVRFCDEPLEKAFVRTVRENVRHGLPLTYADRTAAAGRILTAHPHWSDRYVAGVAGLSPKAVADLRKGAQQATGPTHRLGRDGRLRPTDADERRRRAAEILRSEPDSSLREVGRLAGISPTTVRDVKRRIENGQEPIPQRSADTTARTAGEGDTASPSPRHDPAAGADPADFPALVKRLCSEPSLRHSADGRLLLRLLDLHLAAQRSSARIASAVPAHQIATVAVVAARCRQIWHDMAAGLERTEK
ncbi:MULTISPECIES: ParB/RepB/Spo0J family partition protein [unclassified Streptomyces]|uniref:ParB/RepB/Spo0J family partition protein n=1 Tax=unclassified Streptomyces TaxID=2593676 RepID=UPI001CD6C093|nr:ParB/RepB/Spo0J family partition protein [Streptomyces sp. CoH27]